MEEMINNNLSFSGSPEYIDIFDDSKSSLTDGVVLGAVCRDLEQACIVGCTSNTGLTEQDLSCKTDGMICDGDCRLDSSLCSADGVCSDAGSTTAGSIIATYDDFDHNYMTTYYGDKCPNWSEIQSGVRKGRQVTASATYASNQLVKLSDLTFSYKYRKLTITYNGTWGSNVSLYNPNNNGEYCVFSTTAPSFSNVTGLNNYCATYNTGYTFEYTYQNTGSYGEVTLIAHQQWKPGYYSFTVYTGNPAHFIYCYLTQAICNTLNTSSNTYYSLAGSNLNVTLNG